MRQEVDVDREIAENQRREESLRRLLLKLTGTGTGGAPDRNGGGMAPGWLGWCWIVGGSLRVALQPDDLPRARTSMRASGMRPSGL